MAAPEKLQEKAELKVVNGSENTSAVLKLIDGGLEKAKDKTTTKKVDQTKPVAVATSNDEEEEKRKREQRGNVLNPFATLIKNFFKVDALPTDAKTENWAGQFAARARNNFEGYKTEEKFVQEIVEANKYDPELAAQAVTDVYRVAKAKGFDVTKIEERVKEIEAKLLSDEPIAGIEVVDTPINVSSLYEEEEPVNVVSIDELRAQKAESETLNPEQRTQKEMEASIASTLGLLDEANPARAKAEEVLRQLKNGELHKFDKEALQKLIVEWIPLQATQIPEPERELIQAVVTTGYRVAEDVGINTEEVKTNVTREVLSRIQQQSPAEDATSLEPKLRIVRPDEQEPEAAETPSNIRAFPEDRIVRQHTEPILADGESEVVKAKKAATLDEGLRNKRTEAERLKDIDTEWKSADGTPERDDERVEKAAKLLNISLDDLDPDLRDEFSRAILAAHAIGKGKRGADGTLDPTVGNYTIGQIGDKFKEVRPSVIKVLQLDPKKDSEKIKENIEKLMDAAILGAPAVADPGTPTTGPDADEDDEDDSSLTMLEKYEKSLKKGGERLNSWEQMRRELEKSEEWKPEGERRDIQRAKLNRALYEAVQNIPDGETDTLRQFLETDLKKYWDERYAKLLAEGRATKSSYAPDGTETTTGRRGPKRGDIDKEKFDYEFEELNKKYQSYVNKALEETSALGWKEKKLAALKVVENVMTGIKMADRVNIYDREKINNPHNMRDFAELLMIADPRKWATREYLEANPVYDIDENGNEIRIWEGEFPMFDEHGDLKEEHIMLWIDDRMEVLDNESPDDQISFFQAIDLEFTGMYRPIQIGNLLRNKGFFTDGQRQLLKFHNEVTNKVWLIGFMRNANVMIKKGFLDEEKIVGVLEQLFQTNTLSKEALGGKTVMEWYFTLPQFFRDRVDPGNADTKVGDVAGEAYLLYHHISNFKYLKENFGDLEYFMTKKGVLRAIGSAMLQSDPRGLNSNDPVLIQQALDDKDWFNRFMRDSELEKGGHSILELFKEDGSFDDTSAHRRAFVDYLNPYYPFQKNQKMLKFSRKMVEQAAAERAGLFNIGRAARKKGEEEEVNALREKWGTLAQGSSFGELLANFMGYPLGAGTNNQTGVQAINVLEKATWLSLYFRKLETIDRAGATGNRFTSGLLKSAFVDYVTGIPTVHGETIIEILRKQHKVRMIEYKARKAKNFSGTAEQALEVGIPNPKERQEVYRKARKNRVDRTFRQIAEHDTKHDIERKQLQAEINELEKEVANSELTGEALDALRRENYAKADLKLAQAIELLEDEGRRETLKKDMQALHEEDIFRVIRLEIASRLQFRRNDSLAHTSHWKNAIKLYHNWVEGKEIDYASFVSTSWSGFEIDQAKLQKEIKKEWITPARYTFHTNKMPMNEMIEDLEDNRLDNKYEDYVWETKPLVEKFFNIQVMRTAQRMWNYELNNPHVDKLDAYKEKFTEVDGKKIYWKDVQFLDDNGRVRRNPDGSLPKEVDAILGDEQFNRVVTKALLLCKVSGDLYGHTKLRTGAKHLSFGQREQAIAALANITAGISDNPEDFTKNGVIAYYFTREDIKMLREMSKNKFWRGLSREFAIEGGVGALGGFFKGLAKIFGEIFK